MKVNGECWQLYRDEVRSLLTLAWPITLTQSLMFSVTLVSMLVCGQLGLQALDAVSLAVTMSYALGTAVLLGLASVFDTLLTQAYGSPYKTQVGLILQRGTVLLVLASFPCCAVLLNGRHLLVLFRQDPSVSRAAQEYLNYVCIGLPAFAVAVSLTKYLQAQNKPLPCLAIWAVCGTFNAAMQYVAVGVLHAGPRGAALVVMATFWLLAVGHVVYIRVSRCYVETWGGLQVAAVLRSWGPIASLAVPGMLMICLEIWCIQAQVFVVGSLGLVQLGVQTILANLQEIVYMAALGVSMAASVRIGNSLGEGKPRRAAVAFVVAMTTILMLVVPSTACSLLLRHYTLRLFTQDPSVISLAARVFPIHSLATVTDSSQTLLSGVIRGLGRQCFGTGVNLLTYYGVYLPLAFCLVHLTSLKVQGAWWALVVSTGLQAVTYLARILVLDWTKEADLALARVKGDDIVDDNGADSVSSEAARLHPPEQSADCRRYSSTEARLPPDDGSQSQCEGPGHQEKDTVSCGLVAWRVALAIMALLSLLAGVVVDYLLSWKLDHFSSSGNATSLAGWGSNVTSA